jgi:hypothetical protein
MPWDRLQKTSSIGHIPNNQRPKTPAKYVFNCQAYALSNILAATDWIVKGFFVFFGATEIKRGAGGAPEIPVSITR